MNNKKITINITPSFFDNFFIKYYQSKNLNSKFKFDFEKGFDNFYLINDYYQSYKKIKKDFIYSLKKQRNKDIDKFFKIYLNKKVDLPELFQDIDLHDCLKVANPVKYQKQKEIFYKNFFFEYNHDLVTEVRKLNYIYRNMEYNFNNLNKIYIDDNVQFDYTIFLDMLEHLYE